MCHIILNITIVYRHNTIFKDVYREVGMLEVFVTCLHRYATLLKDKQAAIDQGLGNFRILLYYISLHV